ncbi:SIP domain-containing protein [Streptomyces albipurpureus]|uniref:SIP domain-containing protein n=1 Tax=Streptomyces albipurpureus TaxID=2897419 RepID=A0ABT0ULW5_9ACTN|nr:siderophore-interacting protein [Streptomyces sp. CWNU-1]MCM2389617.1 SIP domain-containing protein [Streptomyces sp. CWNU-1]
MARSLRSIEVFPITTRTLDVLRVTDVTPGMRRVTLGGPELAAHTAANGYPVAAFRSEGFDDEFKIILKHPDAEAAVGPTQADGVLNWPREDPHMLFRTYTVRRWDPVAGELDIDFVQHGVGPAAAWAYRVRPGERVQIAGPKSSSLPPEGADWTLVAGDETALPAIGRWLEEWPAGARGQVFIEIGQPQHRQDLPVPDGVTLTWLSRDGAEPGTTTLLFDAIREAPWRQGTVHAWIAGETLTLTPIRRWLRNEKGLAKEQVDITGYWRRQQVAVSDQDASLPDFTASEDETKRFHELAEILPGFAVRIAATIGLAAAFDGQPRTIAELATATGSDPAGLGKLLRYLAAVNLTERLDGDRYQLTGLGGELESDYLTEAFHLDGLRAQRELGGVLSLLAAVRTGQGDHARWFGAEYAQRVQNDPALLAARTEHEAEEALYVAGALAAAAAFAGLSTVAVAGPAPGSFATALTKVHPELRATIVAAPSEIEALQRVYPANQHIAYEPGSLLGPRPVPADAVLLADVLRTLTDADAAHVLRQAAGSLNPGGRVLVFGDVLNPDVADEHDYEDDLIDFALYGGGTRDHEAHRALFTAAGLHLVERTTVGWGYTLYTLAPRG